MRAKFGKAKIPRKVKHAEENDDTGVDYLKLRANDSLKNS